MLPCLRSHLSIRQALAVALQEVCHPVDRKRNRQCHALAELLVDQGATLPLELTATAIELGIIDDEPCFTHLDVLDDLRRLQRLLGGAAICPRQSTSTEIDATVVAHHPDTDVDEVASLDELQYGLAGRTRWFTGIVEALHDALLRLEAKRERQMMGTGMCRCQTPQALTYGAFVRTVLGYGDEARFVDGLFRLTRLGYGLQIRKSVECFLL